ncbi:hypothetical protein GO003_019025 [Methylicorpusculum oleiharenae]|uniref:hypothetical protein n=1 Tax=Methylicorpusculum oleiharenae TaxID=1338687 RepID=UPI00135882F5|nr:hypothetical protein [Methylicorpusculum oleiharenae]MCD2452481.1 hypothetical protein [Methylicorpusculum oleiharenae]
MSKLFIGVEYVSGRKTTTGTPNPKTGRLSKAVKTELFTTKAARDAWVNRGKVTADMRGNCREAETLAGLRALHAGMSKKDFDEMMRMLEVDQGNDGH